MYSISCIQLILQNNQWPQIQQLKKNSSILSLFYKPEIQYSVTVFFPFGGFAAFSLYLVLWNLSMTYLGVVFFVFIKEFSEPQCMKEEKPRKCRLIQNVYLFPWSYPILFFLNLVNFSTLIYFFYFVQSLQLLHLRGFDQ